MIPDVSMLIERANLLLEQGRIREAEGEIRKVLEQEPRNDHALSVLARCFLNSSRIEEGIEAMHQAIAVNPMNSFHFYLLGFGYFKKGDTAKAVSYLEKALSLYPYEAEYFGLLAYMLLGQRKHAEALEKADEGLALEPDNNTCLNARSTALNKMGRIDDAIQTMQEALSHNPDSDYTHVAVGWNHVEKGRHKEATKHFLEALRLNPGHDAAKAGLKEALKSRIPPYRWLLQYSFWLHNKGRRLQTFMPIILYVAFRVLTGMLNQNESTSGLSWIVLAVYILFVVTSWTINSIANFFLLFHPLGKHALTSTEKWSALSSVLAIVSGITMMCVAHFSNWASETAYDKSLFLAGMVALSLALPFSMLHFPMRFRNYNWREWFTIALAFFGTTTLLLYAVAPEAAMQLLVVYGIAFIIYNWTGLIQSR